MPAELSGLQTEYDQGGKLSHHSILVLFTFIWGANFILAEVALRQMSPISFSVSRFAMGGLTMLSLLYLYNHNQSFMPGSVIKLIRSIDKEDWGRLLLVAVIGATLAPWLGIEGLDLTNGARASIWLALGPAVSTLFGYLFSTEKIGFYGFSGVILAVLGTIILTYDGLRPGEGFLEGDLLLCTALILTVVELHLIKPLARKYGAISVITIRTVIGGTLYVLIASPSLIRQHWLTFNSWTWIAILAGGVIGVGVGQWIKVRALRSLGPTRVVIYGNLVPVAALLIAWLTVHDVPSVLELVATGLIISGAILIQVVDALMNKTKAITEDSEVTVISGTNRE